MSYQWAIDAEEVFGERYPQMINTGLPVGDVNAARAAISEMWPDAPGGWVYEWSQLASRYAAADSHHLAALAYGWAKFPTLADEAKRTALARQIEQYLLAAPNFGIGFERRILDIPHRGTPTPVPVHILTPVDVDDTAPILLISGGVDTWKVDLHALMVGLAAQTHTRVMAFDIAGTGESAVPMTPEGGAEIVRGLIAEARGLGNGIVVHVGISMGGHYSAHSGLTGEVDAAVVLGGPVDAAFAPGGLTRFGMRGIISNALGFDHEPTDSELSEAIAAFRLGALFDTDVNTPMLIVNGADDVHVPQHDTLVFEGRRDSEVHLLPGTGHCAVTKMPEVVPLITDWIVRTLATMSPKETA